MGHKRSGRSSHGRVLTKETVKKTQLRDTLKRGGVFFLAEKRLFLQNPLPERRWLPLELYFGIFYSHTC